MNTFDVYKDDSAIAETLFAGLYAKEILESRLLELLGKDFDDIGYDPYDVSIEIMVGKDCVIPDNLPAEMYKFGFWKGYINFSDGTEMRFNREKFFERITVSYPKWTEEKRGKFYQNLD